MSSWLANLFHVDTHCLISDHVGGNNIRTITLNPSFIAGDVVGQKVLRTVQVTEPSRIFGPWVRSIWGVMHLPAALNYDSGVATRS